jgi:hypothetical protein
MDATLEQIQSAADAALARGDIPALRRALRLGATFASFTIRQRTEVAERHFEQWLAAGAPDDVRLAGVHATWTDKNRRLAGIADLTDEEVLACFTLPEHVAAMHFADRVPGYGCPKANFALACAGARGAAACFDSHLVKRHAERVALAGWRPDGPARATLKGQKVLKADQWHAYAALCLDVYGDASAHGQWSEWLADFARDCGHLPLVDAILGALSC